MHKTLIVAALTLALAACQQSSPPPAPAPAPTAADTSTPPPAPPVADPQAEFATHLAKVIAGEHRSEENRARDAFRNPQATLAYFGLEGGQRVIEITPGGGWYTEILAPALKGNGSYVAAIIDPASASSERAQEYYTRSNASFAEKLAANADLYGEARVVEFSMAAPSFGEEGSADLVLTFRNVHNWVGQNAVEGMFAGFFQVLRPGGVLGVVEHRAAPGDERDLADIAKTGYFPEQAVIDMATKAGFELVGQSDINANPKDTKDHPDGVWNLPPSLRVPEGEDAEKYRAIGESDRMTLKFVKPAG